MIGIRTLIADRLGQLRDTGKTASDILRKDLAAVAGVDGYSAFPASVPPPSLCESDSVCVNSYIDYDHGNIQPSSRRYTFD